MPLSTSVSFIRALTRNHLEVMAVFSIALFLHPSMLLLIAMKTEKLLPAFLQKNKVRKVCLRFWGIDLRRLLVLCHSDCKLSSNCRTKYCNFSSRVKLILIVLNLVDISDVPLYLLCLQS